MKAERGVDKPSSGGAAKKIDRAEVARASAAYIPGMAPPETNKPSKNARKQVGYEGVWESCAYTVSGWLDFCCFYWKHVPNKHYFFSFFTGTGRLGLWFVGVVMVLVYLDNYILHYVFPWSACSLRLLYGRLCSHTLIKTLFFPTSHPILSCTVLTS